MHATTPDCWCRPTKVDDVYIHHDYPLRPTEAMKMAGAERLARIENDGDWPAGFDALEIATMKNEAERVWRSMLLAWIESQEEE